MWTVLQAEVKRYFRVQWSNPGDSISWFLYTFLVLVAAIAILKGISGGAFGQGEQLVIFVGWLTWVVASDCMAELPYAITEEAQDGTLEQLCLAPTHLAGLLVLRSLAYLLGVGAKGVLAAILLGVFVAPLPAGSALVLLFLISLVGAYGLGFLFAGIALVFKRTQALVGLVFSLMIFLTGSLVGLESLGWIYQVLRLALPLTWGISMMRSVLANGDGIAALLQGGDLIRLSLHSLAYLSLGLVVFAFGYRKARQKGTVGHY